MCAASYSNRQFSVVVKECLQEMVRLNLAQRDALKAQTPEQRALFETKAEEIDQKLRGKEEDLNFTLKTGLESFTQGLEKLWADYEAPTQTVDEFVADYENGVRNKTRDKLTDGCLLEVGIITKGIKATADTYEVTGPLVFTGQINYELLKRLVAISPMSKALDWAKTLRRLLTFGAEHGLSRRQIGEAVQVLCRELKPQYVAAIEDLSDHDKIWSLAASFLDLFEEKRKVKDAMNNVYRPPGESISIAVNRLRVLATESLKLDNPDMDKGEMDRLAIKHATRALPSLMEKNTFEELQRYKASRWVQYGRTTTLDESVKFIEETETRPKYQLTSTKRVREKYMELDLNLVTQGEMGGNMEAMDPHSEDEHEWEMVADLNPLGAAGGAAEEARVFSRPASPGSEPPAPPPQERRKTRTAARRIFPQKSHHTRRAHQSKPGTFVYNQRWAAMGAVSPPRNKKTATADPPGASAAPAMMMETPRSRPAGEQGPQWRPREYSDDSRPGSRQSFAGNDLEVGTRGSLREPRRDSRISVGGQPRYLEPRYRDEYQPENPEMDSRRYSDRRQNYYGGHDRRNSASRSRERRQGTFRDGGYQDRERSRERRDRSKSPFSGRGRLQLRSRSGNHVRSISRSRLEVRGKDGRFQRRQLSRSPSAEKKRRCSTCNRQHFGACNLDRNRNYTNKRQSDRNRQDEAPLSSFPLYSLDYTYSEN